MTGGHNTERGHTSARKYRSIDNRLIAGVLLMSCGALPAQAASLALLAPFGDFALRDPAEPAQPGPPVFYDATSREAGWHIVQWDIPGGRLSPFSRSKSGAVEVIDSTAPEAAIRIIRGPRRRAIKLVQDGAVLPCTDKHGAPRESDLFFGPKDRAAPGPNALTAGPIRLDQIRSLVLTTTARVRYGMTAFPKGCPINQGAAIAAVVLNNLFKHPAQTLFYKVSLSAPCGPGPAARVRMCEAGTKAAGFYFRHNPFGVDDWLPLLGQPFLAEGERREITLDLLPRLRQLIASGPEEMDHDPAHWVIDNAYAGQHIWGDFRLASSWEGFQLSADPK
ncbi:MAG TPA: hypothetical protein VJ779_04775 [Acetobacteraceae bacterium]|jgi:hypothetical protein|nr:hypothetical protein [Acetobacteraceae bacterium]